MKSKLASRRTFLKQTTALALTAGVFPSIAPASALAGPGRPGANGRVSVGCIGAGERGRSVLEGFLQQKDVQVVGVCDVKKDQLALGREQVNKHYQNQDCATFGDFREIISQPDIDAFLIATPDHWHVVIGLAAVRAGKDIYLEKPMGLSLSEDWAL